MGSRSIVHAAARNNAEWCDAFCRAHGVVGRFGDRLWSSPVRTPPLYPDAVTLDSEVAPELVLSAIDTSEGCGVKDSFASLALDAEGFRPLFHADWLSWKQVRATPAAAWTVVTGDAELREWEAAWGEVPGEGAFFRRALLDEERIAVLAGYERDRIAAGAVATRSSTVVGLGNVFDAAGDLESAWRAAAAAAASLWGPMPVVSYDSGPSLDAAHDAGFETVGELVVWVA